MEVKISNQFKKGGLMKSLVAGLTMTAISLWGMFSFAQESFWPHSTPGTPVAVRELTA
jgi:hypothetical protein